MSDEKERTANDNKSLHDELISVLANLLIDLEKLQAEKNGKNRQNINEGLRRDVLKALRIALRIATTFVLAVSFGPAALESFGAGDEGLQFAGLDFSSPEIS